MEDNILKQSESILETLRDDEQSSYYSGLLIILVSLFLSVNVFHFVNFGFSFKILIAIFILLFFLVFYRMKMKSAFRISSELSNYKELRDEDVKQYLSGFLRFLDSGADIKIVRISYIKYLYMIVFPIFLFLFTELLIGQFSGVSTIIWLLMFGYIICGLAWYYYFTVDLEEWEELKEEINELATKVHL